MLNFRLLSIPNLRVRTVFVCGMDEYQVGFTNCVDCREVVFTANVTEWVRLDIRSVRIYYVCEFCGSDGLIVLDARIWAAYLADSWLEGMVHDFAIRLEGVRTLEDLGVV